MGFRVAALGGSLLLHLLVVERLFDVTALVPDERAPRPLRVEIRLDEPPREAPPAPPRAPLREPAGAAGPPPRQARKPSPAAPGVPSAPTQQHSEHPAPAPIAVPPDLLAQGAALAAEIAREQASPRPAFTARSLDSMLPDADSGRLPGFRPRGRDGASHWGRRLGALLQAGVPQAAVDPDAPMDLLTEGWERKHHGSELADCGRQHQQLDRELRRQMCGELR